MRTREGELGNLLRVLRGVRGHRHGALERAGEHDHLDELRVDLVDADGHLLVHADGVRRRVLGVRHDLECALVALGHGGQVDVADPGDGDRGVEPDGLHGLGPVLELGRPDLEVDERSEIEETYTSVPLCVFRTDFLLYIERDAGKRHSGGLVTVLGITQEDTYLLRSIASCLRIVGIVGVSLRPGWDSRFTVQDNGLW